MQTPPAAPWRAQWLAAVRLSTLTPPARFVARLYATFARGEDDLVFAALDDLVEETGYARSTVAAARRALVDEGWLVLAVQGRQHRADLYRLAIPVDAALAPTVDDPAAADDVNSPVDNPARGPGDRPLRGPGDRRLAPGSLSPGLRGPIAGLRGPGAGPYKERTLRTSSSSPRDVVAGLLGITTDDEDGILDHVDEWLAAQPSEIGHAAAWLRACHANGDLERSLRTFVARRHPAKRSRRRQAAQAEQLWPLVVEAAGGEDLAHQAVTGEAQAMGLDTRHPAAIRSALITLRSVAS